MLNIIEEWIGKYLDYYKRFLMDNTINNGLQRISIIVDIVFYCSRCSNSASFLFPS